MTDQDRRDVNLALPKGRMQQGVFGILAGAGIAVRVPDRGYRPVLSVDGFDAKLLKPQNVVEMLDGGSRDLGFAGADWVSELGADVVELLDTELDPVRVVAAAPRGVVEEIRSGVHRTFVVASEYVAMTERWIAQQPFEARFVRSYGATEAFPPEDADMIVDNAATGATLRDNGLEVLDVLQTSSTRLYAHPGAVDDRRLGTRIQDFVLLIQSVLDARRRVMLEVNVAEGDLADLVTILPCMKEPTVSRLHGQLGYAVRAAVPKDGLPELLLSVKACGGTDLVVTNPTQIVP